MKILIIEDDSDAAFYLAKGLTESGHNPSCVENGIDGLHEALEGMYDLLIVDRMLPGMDGLSLVKALRAADKDVPVLFLTALGEVSQRVEGLQGGGDDYLVKPFSFVELLARIDAILRRGTPEKASTYLTLADLEMDTLKRTIRRNGQAIHLQPREFRLLEYLLRHAGQVISRTQLLEDIWDFRFDPQTNIVDVHICRLRNKIDSGFSTPLLHTVRGFGYTLRDQQ